MEQNQKREKPKRKVHSLLIMFLICLVTIIIPNSTTLSKYVLEEETDNGLTNATDFYFTSNYMTETQKSYDIYDTAGVKAYIYNYDLDNALLITNLKIEYTQTITYYKNDGSVTGTTTTSISIAGGLAGQNEILIHDKTADYAIVTIVSTAPFSKTISARFNFKTPSREAFYYIEDKDSYVELVIVTGDSDIETLTLTWEGKNFTIDDSNELLTGMNPEANEFALTNLIANSTYKVTFYKKSLDIKCSQSGENKIQSGTINITQDW